MIITDIHFDEESERGAAKKPAKDAKEKGPAKETPVVFTESFGRSYQKARTLAATLGAPETHLAHLFAVLAREKIGRAELEARGFAAEQVFATSLDIARRLPAMTEDRARTEAPAGEDLAALIETGQAIAQGHERLARPVSTGDVLEALKARRAAAQGPARRFEKEILGPGRVPMPESDPERAKPAPTPPPKAEQVIDVEYTTIDDKLVAIDKALNRLNERQARLQHWSRSAIAASSIALLVSFGLGYAVSGGASPRAVFAWFGLAESGVAKVGPALPRRAGEGSE
jgi:hypothetical protein